MIEEESTASTAPHREGSKAAQGEGIKQANRTSWGRFITSDCRGGQ